MSQDKAAIRERLYKQAEAMVPALRERASETERLHQLHPETIKAFQEAGFFRILQPARYGGYELDPHDFFYVQMKVAEGCMSSAWVLGVVAIHNWQLGLFDDKAQQDVWGKDTSVLISSSYMPVGKVTRVDGGYRISGRWGFSSGSKHCDWVFLGSMIPPLKEGDAPDMRTFLLPISDYKIVENWDTSGLEGTGSHDIVVEDAFVPEHRTHKAIDGFNTNSPGNAVNTHPVFRVPFGQIFVRAVSSSSIGALQGALDAYLDVTKVRVGLNDGKRTVLDPTAQMAAAEAMSVIDECKTILYRNFDRMMEAANGGAPLTMEERIKMRFDSAMVSPKCFDAAAKLFFCCGAKSIFKDHPVNRAFRDIACGRTHVANGPDKYGRNLGGVMMGLENTDFFL